MSLAELILLAVALSMDAFAVSICLGLGMAGFSLKKALIPGLYFGFFQAVMPLIGYITASLFADGIIAFDHWIAFALLMFIGSKMIIGAFKKESCPDGTCPDRECPGGERSKNGETSLSPKQMLPLAVATSIDALAVGVSFAFLQVSIIPAVSFIGATTLGFSMIGVKIGSIFGLRYKSKAEITGGIILIGIGIKILLEHTIPG